MHLHLPLGCPPLLQPMPNLATESEAVGYPFHYMLPTRDAKTIALVRRFAGRHAPYSPSQPLTASYSPSQPLTAPV